MKEEKNLYPLSHPQRRIWYSEKLHPGTSMWNIAGTLKIKGKLNLEYIEKAVLAFIEKNDTIRLRITEVNGVPFQYIAPFTDQRIDVIDFSSSGLRQLFEWDQAQTAAPMTMLDSCLYYFAIIKLPGGKGALYAKVHHIMSDGFSLVLASGIVIDNYRALLSGEPLNQDPPGSYIDYIHNERKYLESKRFVMDRQFWNRRFESPPEPTVLKEKKETYYGTRARRKAFMLQPKLSEQIRAYCRQTNKSIFTFFMSALSAYIFRVTGKRDIVVGAPVVNRTTQESKTSIGMYVSTVPVRIEIDENLPFDRFMQTVSNAWMSVLKHQKYPYNLLLQDLRKTHKGLESLYDITLSYQNAMFDKKTRAFTEEGRWHFSGHQVTSLSIHVDDHEGEGRFIMDYDHHVPLFSLKEIEYIHEHMFCIINDVLAYPKKNLARLNMLTVEEADRILNRFNDTKTEFPEGKSLADLWKAQVMRSPGAVAVIAGESSLTYAKLDARAGALARRLRAMGLGPDSIVGVMVDRSLDLPVCILGVLKAGCAFLPINPELPAERVSYMLEDCGARALLLSERLLDRFRQDLSIEILTTDTIRGLKGTSPKVRIKPEDLAYVIYTSGSTGMPKGVAIEHRSIVHFLYSLCSIMDFSPGNRVLCAASISFDLFIMESLPTLVSGATLVLAAEHETSIPRKLARLLEKNKVNKLMFTPSRMQLLLSDELARKCLPHVREIMLGGDVLSDALLRKIKACTGARILNFYGPTEITIAATCKDLTDSRSVNIGKPMPNTKIYILDAHKNPVPIGVYGELYISGRGLARGYVNRPELTAAAFVDNPFAPGEKMYRTGDLARWYPLGDIEFLGRVDQQVKIRGYRIELGEIENRLSQVQGVRSCAVVDRRADENGRKYLCAYICGSDLPTRSQLITVLSRDLPGYMIPSYFVVLDELPLNFSGKLDKKRLPDPLKHAITTVVDDFDPPATETEKALASIWSRILKVHPIGRNDSFFDIGGDSLSIVAAMGEVQNTFHVDISLEDMYRAPSLKACAECIDSADKQDYRPIRPVPARRYYPVSPAQMRMYVLSIGDGSQTVYNIPLALKITGPLDVAALEKAFQALIRRHGILRTGFVMHGNRLCQQIRKHVDFSLEVDDCPPSGLRSALKNLNRPFDLSVPPLLRATLLSRGQQSHILYINIHHSVCDGHSMDILLKELFALYSNKLPLGKDIEYKDYTMWHLDFLASEAGKKQGAYWKAALGDGVPLLNLHTDRPRGALQTFAGARMRFTLPETLSEKLRNFAQGQDVTLFMLFFAVYNVFLYKYTSQEDIVVGVPVAGRSRDELKDMPGMFVNTLPIRSFPRSDMTFGEFLSTVRENCLLALQNADYPLDLIVSDLGIARSLSRNPLFDTMLVLQTISGSLPQMEGLKVSLCPFDPGTAKLDLTLEVYDNARSLRCEFEYNTALFKKNSIVQMARHFTNLLQTLTEQTQIPLKRVQVLTPEEIRELTWMNFVEYELDSTKSIQGLFEQRVYEHPEKPALIMEGTSLTYAQLNDRANQIARHLIGLGVQRNEIVAVCLRRSFDLVAGILGVLKAGAAYLPIDPEYPKERIRFVLSDSQAAVLLTDCPDFDGYLATTVNTDSILLYEDAANPCIPELHGDLAYVIYTSGSTGLPKGVAIARVSLLNYYEGAKRVHNFRAEDICVSITTVAFDIFVEDTLVPLFCGCTVVLSSDEESKQPHLVADLLNTQKAAYIQATPTRMLLMMSDSSFKKAISRLRIIALGGEPVPLSLLKLLKRHTNARIINWYGPTEATVYCTVKDLTKSSRITIGHPILNMRMYVLDKHQNFVPPGVPGEGYISGIGVSVGYIHREKLTKERFLPDPFVPGDIMYRTGDVCRLNSSGDLEMLGRVDYQVKIHGHRIELGEIETTIRSFPNIVESVVKDFGANTDKYLAAYFTASQPVDLSELREHLGKQLPAYMIPSRLIEVDNIPLTSNGKIDRKALPEPSIEDVVHTSSQTHVPLTKNERIMRRIWSKILGVKNIGPDDNFFALGGSSLDVIRVQAAILQYDWRIRTQDFYDLQTLRAVCNAIGQVPKNQGGEQGPEARKNVAVNRADKPLGGVKLDRVLLTGATGYLGVHILHELITAYDSTVYCLVRDNKHIESTQRLKQTLAFYFGAERSERLTKNIRLVQGDVSSRYLGIQKKEWEALGKSVSAVIHCAALTSHIGRAELFTQVNVTGTENVVAFCEQAGASLMHVSTISVSGTRYTDDPGKNGTFSEDCYYIGQNYLDNEYVKTKFMAEGAVLDAIDRGLDARIFRVGNLTCRYEDAKFQINPHANAFAQRIRSLATLGCVPMGMLAATLDMTPVDKCAQAILALSRLDGMTMRVFHVYNPHDMTVSDLVGAMRAEGVNVDTVSNEAFGALLKDLSRKGDLEGLSGIMAEAGSDMPAPLIVPASTKTKECLSLAGFEWPRPEIEYIRSFVHSLLFAH